MSQEELKEIEEEIYGFIKTLSMKQKVLPKKHETQDDEVDYTMTEFVSRGYYEESISPQGEKQWQWTEKGFKIYAFLRTLKWFIGMNVDPFLYLEENYKAGKRQTQILIQTPMFSKTYKKELENVKTGKRSYVDFF